MIVNYRVSIFNQDVNNDLQATKNERVKLEDRVISIFSFISLEYYL